MDPAGMIAGIISARVGLRLSLQRCDPGMRVVAPLSAVNASRETIVPWIGNQPNTSHRPGPITYNAHQGPRPRQRNQTIIRMYVLFHASWLNIHSMITRHQKVRLQEVIIKLQHRLVYRKAIECAAFICEGIDASSVEAFEGISTAF